MTKEALGKGRAAIFEGLSQPQDTVDQPPVASKIDESILGQALAETVLVFAVPPFRFITAITFMVLNVINILIGFLLVAGVRLLLAVACVWQLISVCWLQP